MQPADVHNEEHPPLEGLVVAVTHPISSDDPFASRLRSLGADVLECPSIQIVPPEDSVALEESLARLREYDWVLLTSKSAVDAVHDVFQRNGWDFGRRGDCRIAVVGRGTGARLERIGLEPDLVPETFSGSGLAERLIRQGDANGKRFLFPCSEIAREDLCRLLSEAGGHVDRVTAYRTVTSTYEWPDREALLAGDVDAVCFTSSSTVSGFRERLGEENFQRVVASALCLSIGSKTSKTLNDLGVKGIVEAKVSSFDGLVDLILERFGE
jgi:uroporphyrinogen III methyltransferase / synthase